MFRRRMSIFLSMLFLPIFLQAADRLIIDMDLDADVMSMNHHVDGFLFKPTMNFSSHMGGNLSDMMKTDSLKNHLVLTGLVRINGEIAGVATEQEVIVYDKKTGIKHAESAWLIMLNYPGKSGFIAVKQQEDHKSVFGLVNKVKQNPQSAEWEDGYQRFLSTSNSPTIPLAADDLEMYQGGRFEEYSLVNPTDIRNYGRFRAKIQFVIYPPE